MHDVTAFVSHEDSSRHDTGWNHPDHQGRLPAIVRAVQRDMVALWEPLRQLEAVPASEADLLLVHTPEYVARVREKSAESAREGRTLELDGVPVSGATWDAVLASAGAALTAVDAVLDGDVRNAFALARPPGRGASADAPGEFSLVNTVAIAARYLRTRWGVGHNAANPAEPPLPRSWGRGRTPSRGTSERPSGGEGPPSKAGLLVVAWGAHPPVALARLLAEDEGMRMISIYQHPRSFPDPRPMDADPPVPGIALPPGSDGAAIAAALRDALDAIPAEESPDFVLLSAGFDILEADAHGSLAVQPDEVHDITTVLRDWVDARAGRRLVSVLEGGYDAAATARAVIQHLRALAGVARA